ncbi:DUF2225 domain-containing protein [Heyndrickxia sp. NPDC080065]|uniref:DUF2225 domain-containing protein n=1 Tax=Heyndrickxia sp. NPDC080065 TaxID=3390568 RepID=UPI003CFF7B4F
MNTTLTPYYEKKLQCLLCKTNFISTKIRSSFVKVDFYDKDFCPNYFSDEVNPLFYSVFVCPHCGFSFTEYFSKYFPPGTREDIINKVSNRWVSQDYGKIRKIKHAIASYKLAAYCGEIKREKNVTIAGLYIRIAWLYRKINNKVQEQRFLRFAMNEYLNSYLNSDFHGSQMSELKIIYLIAELSYQIGEEKQAVLYLSKVIEKQNTTTERTIVEMALERWHEIKAT